jgi:hypothetical protein
LLDERVDRALILGGLRQQLLDAELGSLLLLLGGGQFLRGGEEILGLFVARPGQLEQLRRGVERGGRVVGGEHLGKRRTRALVVGGRRLRDKLIRGLVQLLRVRDLLVDPLELRPRGGQLDAEVVVLLHVPVKLRAQRVDLGLNLAHRGLTRRAGMGGAEHSSSEGDTHPYEDNLAHVSRS